MVDSSEAAGFEVAAGVGGAGERGAMATLAARASMREAGCVMNDSV